MYARNGVTYSAYGQGEKPKILGSPENGADPGKWKLLDGTKNIWVFYKDIQDCGNILFNDGESMALKTCAFWDGKKYCKSSNDTTADEPRVQYDIKTLENLRFFNEIFYVDKYDNLPFSTQGKLYLRCDKGNPGSIYSSIEFLTGNNDWNEGFASGKDGCVFDNLCVLYGAAGICLKNNSTVQNCEIGWLGGQILQYSFSNLGVDSEGNIVRSGDGIMIFGDNDTVRNNYIHDTYDYGITVEGFAADPAVSAWKRENVTITGNIVEKGYGSALIADWYAWNKQLNLPSFHHISINNNYFLNSGNGWSHQYPGEYTGSITLDFHPGSINDINIVNNVFYLSKYTLVLLGTDSEKTRPVFLGNTYVQNDFGIAVDRMTKSPDNFVDQKYLYGLNSSLNMVAAVLGDKSALFFDQPAPSSWAKAGVNTAISCGLATPELRNGYGLNTTRSEFCHSAVNFLEICYKKPIADVLKDKGLKPLSFNDVQDDAISAAAALGLTSGTGHGNFSPNNPLSREQAATMLSNTLKCMGIDVAGSPDAEFADAGSFSSWAMRAVNTAYSFGIMSGTSSVPKIFSPKTAYSHEQSILTFNNMYNFLKKGNLI